MVRPQARLAIPLAAGAKASLGAMAIDAPAAGKIYAARICM
jgi:hypothetical protein